MLSQNSIHEEDENCFALSQIAGPTFNGNIPKRSRSYNELVVTRNRPASVPFLSEEVRALADAEKFCESATLVLNNSHIKTDIIIQDLLNQMFRNNIPDSEKLKYSVEEAYNEILMNNNDKEGTYFQFAKSINGFEHGDDGSMTPDPSWLVAMASLSWIDDRMLGITTTLHPINMGSSHSSVQLLAIVLTPVREKHTKSDVETSRNIAAILSDPEFRQNAHGREVDEEIFRKLFKETTERLQKPGDRDEEDTDHKNHHGLASKACYGQGIYRDFKCRFHHYWSDYTDAFMNKHAVAKTFITIFVMFFANLLPTIAFGMLNETSTDLNINVSSGIIAQLFGGVIFAIFGGQYLVMMLTTSPLAIMIMVFYNTSSSLGYNFFEFYAWIGIFNTIYLWIYAFTGFSRIMDFSRRSTEETFELFVSVSFLVDALKACVKSFTYYYHGEKCAHAFLGKPSECLKEESLLFLLLLLGTMALGLWLNDLTKTPYLTSFSRKMLSEFALPVSVIFMSFVGSGIFREVKLSSFLAQSWRNITLTAPNLRDLPATGICIAAGMAFPLSILIFMEQSIASSIVHSPLNKLKKGTAFHWDLVVVGFINLILSMFGLPLVHGALPHSPMHVAALATTEDHIDEGNHVTQKVVKVVETRIPSIIANILIGLCIFLMPYPLLYIPAPVLYGLFLYMAFAGLQTNQLFERFLLFITEQSAYPPNHYLKRVPQSKVHMFTLVQSVQLVVLCALGFFPNIYVKMAFPFILILQLPFRHLVCPKLIDIKYLEALDKHI